MRITLGGTAVDLLTREDVLTALSRRLRADEALPCFVASANLDHIYHFGVDSGRQGSFYPGHGGANWLVLLDGVPLVWAAQRSTGTGWEQLAGSDLLPGILRIAVDARSRVGFLGGSEHEHRALETMLVNRFPGLRLAGTWAPAPDVVDDSTTAEQLAASIRRAGVDLLVVGFGKPRQEMWLLDHGGRTGARVALAFGASMAFLAGTTRRAPASWRRFGLEWLYRLLHEPRRLWRRYLLQGPVAMYRLIRYSSPEEL